MAQIGNVPEIKAVKKQFEELKDKGLVRDWEIPYENILTRLSAAIFFFTPVNESDLEEIWKTLGANEALQYKANEEKKLSQLAWKVEFNRTVVPVM
jgi:hypothetical protein